MVLTQLNSAEHIAYLNEQDQSEVLRAIEKATEWHDGQMRSSGEAYVLHPIAVMEYLASLKAGKDTLIAGLLHDVIEDERATYAQVEELFGVTVAKLVEGVTKLSKLRYEGKRVERQLASLRKMLLSANEDLRVIFIKLADRFHNVQTISALSPEKQARIAHETLEIYVPFARLVGLWNVKRVFETVCFPLAFPEESKTWHEQIALARASVDQERQDFVRRINAETATEVEARIDRMTDFQIYQKLQGQLTLLQDVRNIDSINIVTHDGGAESESDCYALLGEVHKRYPILSDGFRDYISTPQANGYRALHTTVFIAQNHLVRLRIQTQFMHEYSTRRRLSDWAVDPESNLRSALSALHMSSSDQLQYLHDLKSSVLSKHISVFTTMGEIIVLPADSTGVDFVYAVNPGHIRYLQGIWINGERMEPTHVLKDGDTVESILLAEENKGENAILWLKNAKSLEAREGIRRSLKEENPEELRGQAMNILSRELGKMGISPHIFRIKTLQNIVAKTLNKTSFDALLSEVGSGMLSVGIVAETFRDILMKPKSVMLGILSTFHLLPTSRIFDEKAHIIKIEVYAQDRKGLIHDITRCFSQRDVNIAKFGVFAYGNGGALYKISLEVENYEEFSDIFDALLQVPSVTEVLRKS